MASGSAVTISGGTTMTQVVAGDTIDDADFNNARANVDRLLSGAQDVTLGTFTLSSTYGYGQGGAGVNATAAGNLVYADNATGGFKRLQDDVQALCAFLGQTVRTGVGTDVTAGDTISATTWSNLMLNIKDCWDNRFSPASRTTTTDASVTRTTQWKTSLAQETTWTFANEGDLREFFNGGGRLGFSSSRTGGSSTTQNTNWTNLLSAMGDVYMTYDTTFSTGATGTSAGKGLYELSTSNQQLYIKYGSGSYASNYFRMLGRVNSTTNPTVITLRAEYSDPHVEGSGSLGPDGAAGTGDEGFNNDYIDGTLTLNARRQQPAASGSGFTFSAPSDSMGGISGS